MLGKIPRLALLPRNDMSWGGSVQPHRLYSGRGWRQIAAATPDSSNVIPFFRYGSGIGTWRAADCRPYIRNTLAYIVPTKQNVLPPIILPQRKSPTGRFGKPLPWGCWLFGADAPGVDLGDFRLFVQEDQVGVFAGGDGAFGFPQAHFPGGVFRQGGEDLFQGQGQPGEHVF